MFSSAVILVVAVALAAYYYVSKDAAPAPEPSFEDLTAQNEIITPPGFASPEEQTDQFPIISPQSSATPQGSAEGSSASPAAGDNPPAPQSSMSDEEKIRKLEALQQQ